MSISESRRLDPEFLDPSRIITARMRRGLTKTDLARSLSVTPRTINKYESEGAPISARDRIAEALAFPGEYFTKPSVEELTPSDVSFPAGSRVSAKIKGVAVASGRNGLELNKWLNSKLELPEMDIPTLEHLTPEQAARLLRHQWGLGSKPLPNLVQLLESKGVRVFGLPPSAEAVDAFSFWHEGTPFVFSARRRSVEGSRFDVAHELGHLVLHSSKSSTFTMDREEEREADRFASEFLIPELGAIEYLPTTAAIEDILKLKRYFFVSAMAMARKALDIGRMTEWGYRQTCVELSRRGYRRGEPDGASSYERSRVFTFLFSPDRSTRVSPQSISRELSLPEEDVHSLTLRTMLHSVPGGNQPGEPVSPSQESTPPKLRLV